MECVILIRHRSSVERPDNRVADHGLVVGLKGSVVSFDIHKSWWEFWSPGNLWAEFSFESARGREHMKNYFEIKWSVLHTGGHVVVARQQMFDHFPCQNYLFRRCNEFRFFLLDFLAWCYQLSACGLAIIVDCTAMVFEIFVRSQSLDSKQVIGVNKNSIQSAVGYSTTITVTQERLSKASRLYFFPLSLVRRVIVLPCINTEAAGLSWTKLFLRH